VHTSGDHVMVLALLGLGCYVCCCPDDKEEPGKRVWKRRATGEAMADDVVVFKHLLLWYSQI